MLKKLASLASTVTSEEIIPVFLSHDVDWGKSGAPISHIIARKNRFDEATLNSLETKNPYQNISEIMDIEEAYGLRSTFFFRTRTDSTHPPPSYDITEYRSDIRSMVSGGWEVGLHSDPLSLHHPETLLAEKKLLEGISGTSIVGNRIHYTVDANLHVTLVKNLKSIGILYDSSVKFERNRLTYLDCMSFKRDGIIVFPISLMDALIFMNLFDERAVLRTVKSAIDYCKELPPGRMLTILWHNCSLKMKFGRRYSDVIEYLASNENVLVGTGRELLHSI